MKNSRNKIVAAAVCGVITGAVGTSVIGNFQANNQINSQVANSNNTDSFSNGSNGSSESFTQNYGGRQGRGDGGKGNHHKGEVSLDSTEGVNVTSGQYDDGTYAGTSSGYSSGLKVEVTISNGQISDVQVVSHNETPGFCERAIETVPSEIVSLQSTNVDTVSGATYTSVGIINAVNNALSNAQNS